MNNLRLLGSAFAISLAFAGCNTSTDDDASGSAGSGAEAGSTGEAGSSAEAGSAGAGELPDTTELATWPMPNAPGSGLPNIERYDATSTAGVVHDKVTGLDWQQNPGSAPLSRADAITHCDTLSLAGFDDWRAPTYIELVSLFDAVPDDSDPKEPIYIATDVFSIGVRYWSTTPAVGTDTTLGRLVDFSAAGCGGNSGECSIGVAGKKADALGGAFCVRSSAPPPTKARFEIGERIEDTFTGLSWTTLPSAIQTGTYDDAVTRCDAIGARLPSITELLSIMVPVRDTKAFPNWPKVLFAWSSSPVVAIPGSYWGAADGGASGPFKALAMERIECVQ